MNKHSFTTESPARSMVRHTVDIPLYVTTLKAFCAALRLGSPARPEPRRSFAEDIRSIEALGALRWLKRLDVLPVPACTEIAQRLLQEEFHWAPKEAQARAHAFFGVGAPACSDAMEDYLTSGEEAFQRWSESLGNAPAVCEARHAADRPALPSRAPRRAGSWRALSAWGSLESLEARIAPATLLNASTAIFSDADGDDVMVHFAKPLLTAANLDSVLVFNDEAARPDGSIPQHLAKINVLSLGHAADGMDITVTARHSALHGGDGRVDVYGINAHDPNNPNNVNLGAVKVMGDVTYIDAGTDAKGEPALRRLEVDSLGGYSQGVESEIHGAVGAVIVHGSLGGYLDIAGSTARVGTLTIGGSIGDTAGGTHVGDVVVHGNVGRLSVGGNVYGGLGQAAGSIQVGGSIGSFTIGGSVIGGSGNATGFLSFGPSKGAHGVIRGSLVGADGDYSGQLAMDDPTGRLVIGGDVVGGSTPGTGSVYAAHLHAMTLRGDLVGGSSSTTGVLALQEVDRVTVAGSIRGGVGQGSGQVSGVNLGTILVGHDIVGRAVNASGQIYAVHDIHAITVKGSLIGADDNVNGFLSGSIQTSVGDIGRIYIGGNVSQASIIAGIDPGNDFIYGTGSGSAADFDAASASIARIIIKGAIVTKNHHFAIEANEIGDVTVGRFTYHDGAPGTNFSSGVPLDAGKNFVIREI